ncbi:MAG TPA: helix-turn-helix domain-containing protein [Gemmatimonadaceae bacterium]|nr:helix-turn-helix domain-containing protein [Gemmatimonadaceae bacterium]
MRWWESSVGGPVRGRIIALLRRQERSVEELATELGVTDNAVRAQLQALEREGLVHQSRIRHSGTVGKPATMYAVPESAEPLLSAAYAPVLRALLESLGDRLSKRELDGVLRDVGRRLADQQAATEESDSKQLEARVRAAAELLSSLGAELDVERIAGGWKLRGYACPLSDAVRVEPRTCSAIEELVAGVTGAEVRECCEHADGNRCCFEVKRTA